MKPVYFSPEAEDDLGDIWNYIVQFDDVAADRLIERIRTVRERLQLFPFSDRSRDDELAGLRSISVRPYVVYYRVAEDTVEVARVIHGARDLPSALRDAG